MLRNLFCIGVAIALVASASSLQAREASAGFSVAIDLKKDSFHAGEPLEGEVVIQSSKSGFPSTLNVKIYHEEELRYSRFVHLPQIYFGTETYPLETFGIKDLKEPGPWRIVIGQASGEDLARAEIEILED